MEPEEDEELLDSKISLHDKQRFEVKLDVVLSPEGGMDQYDVEAYFFLPRSLGVNGRTYPTDVFYGDVQNYIRFKTPTIGLRKLADPAYEYSPFRRLDEAVQAVLAGDRGESVQLKAVHEIKLLGCVIRSDVRDYVYFLLTELAGLASRDGKAPPSGPLRVLEEGAMAFLAELGELLAKLRSIRATLLSPGLPGRIREGYLYLDEFVSLTVESYLTILLGRLEGMAALEQDLPRLPGDLRTRVLAEQEHRRLHGYPCVVRADSDNEAFAQRRSLLKKYIASLLYLDVTVAETDTAKEVLLSLAAGTAMLLSLVAMVFVQSRYAFDSLVFVMAAVVTYMFKDRIKEWLKRYFASHLAGWLTDHRVRIVDPSTQEEIGDFQEAVSFVPASSVPEEVRRARGEGREGGAEEVLKYVKKVRLRPSRIFEHHHRLKSLNDILRFSVGNLLGRMDDPKVDLLFLDRETGRLDRVRVARTYLVDVVFRTRARKDGGEEAHLRELLQALSQMQCH